MALAVETPNGRAKSVLRVREAYRNREREDLVASREGFRRTGIAAISRM